MEIMGKKDCPSFDDEYAHSGRVYCISAPKLFQYLISSTLDNIALYDFSFVRLGAPRKDETLTKTRNDNWNPYTDRKF